MAPLLLSIVGDRPSGKDPRGGVLPETGHVGRDPAIGLEWIRHCDGGEWFSLGPRPQKHTKPVPNKRVCAFLGMAFLGQEVTSESFKATVTIPSRS